MDQQAVPSSPSPSPKGGSAPPHLPSLDTAFDLARAQVAEQLQRTADLDAKAGIFLGASVILVGLLTSWQVPHILVHASGVAKLLEWFVFADFAVLAATAITALAVRPLKNPRKPDHLNTYLSKPDQELKGTLLHSVLDAYESNHAKLTWKARWVEIAFWCLVVEFVVASVVYFLQVIST